MATKKPAVKKVAKPAAKAGKTATAKTLAKGKQVLSNNAFATRVRESAQDIWLAGLGAFSKAQDEGNRVYDVLVKEGRSIQGRVRGLGNTVRGKINDTAVADLPGKLNARWNDLGQMVEERASTALSRAGVATKKEVDSLSRRVSKLAGEVEKAIAAKKPVATQKATVVKTAPKAIAKVAPKPVVKAVVKAAKSAPTIKKPNVKKPASSAVTKNESAPVVASVTVTPAAA